MAAVGNELANLEERRLQLEENVAKLRKSLDNWRLWDVDYDNLKGEIELAHKPVSQKELATIRAGFQGHVIEDKEIDEIFGRVGPRPADQIVNLLSRRIDYVTQNIATLVKQLEQAEEKLGDIPTFSGPVAREEDGAPLTDIIEQLDENENVLSTRLHKPGESEAQLLELLEKAGVKDVPEGTFGPERVEDVTEDHKPTKETTSSATPSSILPPTSESTASKSTLDQVPDQKKQPTKPKGPSEDDSTPRYQSISLAELAADPEISEEEPARKSVSFADDTKAEDGPRDELGDDSEISRNAQRVEEIMKTAKDQELMGRRPAVVPNDESEEDAFLRQEMLKYGMDEVGSVVAELTLEEGTDDDDDEGFEELYSDADEDQYDDDEDKHGRFTGRMVDDDYMQRMLELEKRLGVKSRFTEQVMKDKSDSDSDDGTEGIGRIVVNREKQPPSEDASNGSPSSPLTSSLRSASGGDAKPKKSVTFAQDLDIAPDEATLPSAPPPVQAPAQGPTRPEVDPLSDVVERKGPSRRQDTAKKPKRVSRFKKQQAEGPPAAATEEAIPKGPFDMPSRFVERERPTAPTGPEGKIVADTLLEREPGSSQRDDDDYEEDEEFLDQELADAYHRKRRDFIQKHGGFLKEDESPIQPLDEADGGRKMSKFKAARLSKQ